MAAQSRTDAGSEANHVSISVTHIYRTYFPDPPGGLQEAIRQIALGLAGTGIENTVFALSPAPQPRLLARPEGHVLRARSWCAPASCDIGGYAAFSEFARCARQSDVLHFFFPWPFADLMHAVIRPDTPAVMTYISDVVRQRMLGRLYAPLMWRMMKKMRVIVATSPPYARTSPILSHPDIRGKVCVIPHGIDENSYPARGDDGVFARLGVGADEPYFLFIGVLRYYKGLEYLLEAAPGVRAKIVIAGSGPEGARLRAHAARRGIGNVVFAGQVTEEEKVSLLQACRALVLPSHLRSEAFGMVLVEAAIHGRPQISCEIGTGTSYVNADGESGLVVPPRDPAALAGAMNRLLGEPGLAAELGAGARARYERLFSGAAVGRAYAELFGSLARGG